MSVVNNLGDVVMLGTNPLSTEDPEIKTINGKRIKINGVELDPTGGGGGGGSVAKATEFKLENPMTDADTRAVLFQQTENATDLKISTKAGTGNGVITFESGGQTDNKFQVNNLGALCTGNLATKGKIQLADGTTDINLNEVSQFTQGGPNLTISTQQAGDINLTTEATGAHININPNGTNSVKVENDAVRLNAETFVNNNLRLGTDGNEASIFQPSNSKQLSLQTLTDANINECAINIESQGVVNCIANGTNSFIKLGVGSLNKVQVNGGEIVIGAEGANINRLIDTTNITEANSAEARSREATIKMKTTSTILQITTQEDGNVELNTELENSATHLVNSEADGSGTNVSAPLYADLRLFNAVANMYTTYINVATFTPREQTGSDLGTPTQQTQKIFIVINTGSNTPPFGTAPTLFYPFINNTQLAVDGANTTGAGIPLFALADRGISGVEVFCKFFRTNPFPDQKNFNGSGTPPTPPAITSAMLQDGMFPHFTSGGGAGAGTVTSNVIDNWSFQFNFSIPNNNGTGTTLTTSQKPIPVTHSYESIAKFNTGGAATSAYDGELPTINYFADSNNITGINMEVPRTTFNQDISLMDNIFLLTQVRVLSKFVGTALS